METSASLYALRFDEVKTYMWATVFVACNLILPQLFHLIPQGGIIFAPLSLVIMAGAYKFGWKTGLLAAVLSPLVNHLMTGQPVWGMLPVMTLKLVVLAVVAGMAAQYFRKVSVLILVGVMLVSLLLGALGELLLTGGVQATIADVTIGWPGLLLQVVGTWLLLKWI